MGKIEILVLYNPEIYLFISMESVWSLTFCSPKNDKSMYLEHVKHGDYDDGR